MLIVLPNDVLFDSGTIDLKAEGKATLTQVAQVLAGIGDRRFLVAGHTDNVPIKTARFPSNWELSTARAVEVAKLLVAGGMKPEVVGAAGYAEFAPWRATRRPRGGPEPPHRDHPRAEPLRSAQPREPAVRSEALGGARERRPTSGTPSGSPPDESSTGRDPAAPS